MLSVNYGCTVQLTEYVRRVSNIKFWFSSPARWAIIILSILFLILQCIFYKLKGIGIIFIPTSPITWTTCFSGKPIPTKCWINFEFESDDDELACRKKYVKRSKKSVWASELFCSNARKRPKRTLRMHGWHISTFLKTKLWLKANRKKHKLRTSLTDQTSQS